MGSENILLAQPLRNRKRGRPRQRWRNERMNMVECLKCGSGGLWHEIMMSGKSYMRKSILRADDDGDDYDDENSNSSSS